MTFTSVPGKEQYELMMRIRGVCYSAFSSPNLGITWAMLSLASGLVYLIYSERNRRRCDETDTASHAKCNDAGAVDCAEL